MLYEVSNIQYFLNICNYGAPQIDGIPGPETTRCIRTAQGACGLEQDGIWGPLTEACAAGQISAVQRQLTEAGFQTEEDGIAGPQTWENVKAFQRMRKLDADGIIGSLTSAALFGGSSSEAAELRWFGPDEFKCACGCGLDCVSELKQKTDRVRDRLGLPLIVSSGARCSAENAACGGVPDSLHLTGEAADVYTPGMTAELVDRIAQIAREEGLGTIRYYDERFVHLQTWLRDTIA